MNIINALNKAVTFISNIFASISIFCLYSLTALVFLSVFTRFLFNYPIMGADEISGYLNIAIGFLALSYALQTGGHVRVDIITSHVSKKVNNILDVLAYVLALILVGLLIRTAWYTWMIQIKADERATSYLLTPMAIPYGIMVVSWIVFFLALLVGLLKYFADYKSGTATLSKEKSELEQIKEISDEISMST